MVAVWRRAWRSRGPSSSTARGGGGGDASLQPCGSSNTSGTTLSATTYTTTSDPVGERPRDCRPFVILSTPVEEEEAEGCGEERAKELEEERLKTREHIKSLVHEFCGDGSGNARALERWLSELHVDWLLMLAGDEESAGRMFISLQPQHLTRSWILALYEINKSISRCLHGWTSQEETAVCSHASEFLQLFEATFLKLLPFVDAIVAPWNTTDPNNSDHTMDSIHVWAVVAPAEKLQALIDVREALSEASEQIQSWRASAPNTESARIIDEVSEFSSGKLDELDYAMWDTMDEITTGIMRSSSWGAQTPQRSPDIHKVTQSVITYIKLLWTNYGSVNRIVRQAYLRGEYVPGYDNMSPLTNLIVEMLHFLEDELESQPFPDTSLRFLFLINNSYYVWRQLHTNWVLEFPMPFLTHKIEEYIQSYLQVSWAPVLKCLRNSTPLCFTRHSALAKFESRLQKTYAAQKLWKVPDPEMRRRLRKAISRRVYSGYTKFLEDSGINSPRVAPKELIRLLGELFEG